MHSSIYGSAMAARPAAAPASRPSTGGGGAFRAGGVAKPFAAPTSKRTAAEDRIRTHGTGGSEYTFTPRTENMPANDSVVPAGARLPRDNMRGGGRAAGQAPLMRDTSNFLHDGSGGVPMSPSVFSSADKQRMHMAPTYGKPSGQAVAQHMQQQQQQQQQQPPQRQQQQQAGSLAQHHSTRSCEYTVTDLTDASVAVPPSAAASIALGSASAATASQQPAMASSAASSVALPAPAATPDVSEPPAAASVAALSSAASAAAAASAAVASAASAASAVPAPAPAAPINPAEAALGQGVFAKVRMTHGRDGQLVAVKTYNHKEAREERAVAKHMLNEERLAGKLQHDNIIAPQVARVADGRTELEMEYAPGGTLEEHLKKLGRPMAEEEARQMFIQLVDAVVYLHKTGVCHRDIKMENVVLDAEGKPRLVDFGAAKEGGANAFLTSMQGTPAYMAPEVAMQKVHKGGPADVWALGVLLYNLVSGGAFPFWGKSMDELRRNITVAPPRLPPNLSPQCRDLLNRLLQKSGATRITAADVRKHPWCAMGGGGGGSGLGASLATASASARPSAAAAAAHVMAGAHSIQAQAQAAVAADAATAASAYREELHAARAEQAPPKAPASPRTAARVANPQYQHASRNPITGGVSRPTTPGYAALQASPKSASKLAHLMNGNGRPGTPLSGSGRAASEAQLRAAYNRR